MNWNRYWGDFKVTLWYTVVCGMIVAFIALACAGLWRLFSLPVQTTQPDAGIRASALELVVGRAEAAGVTAYNPKHPRLSLAPAGGSGGGPPVAVLSPAPTAGGEAAWLTTLYSTIRAALASKNWILLVAAAMVALLQAAKVLLTPKVPFLRTDRGGVLLAMLAGSCTALANAALTRAWSAQVLLEAVYYGVIYAGGYASVKKLWAPSGADRAQLAEAQGAVAGEAAAGTAAAGAQDAAAAINAILADSSPGPAQQAPRPSGTEPAGSGGGPTT